MTQSIDFRANLSNEFREHSVSYSIITLLAISLVGAGGLSLGRVQPFAQLNSIISGTILGAGILAIFIEGYCIYKRSSHATANQGLSVNILSMQQLEQFKHLIPKHGIVLYEAFPNDPGGYSFHYFDGSKYHDGYEVNLMKMIEQNQWFVIGQFSLLLKENEPKFIPQKICQGCREKMSRYANSKHLMAYSEYYYN